jgi:hypothetical protein
VLRSELKAIYTQLLCSRKDWERQSVQRGDSADELLETQESVKLIKELMIEMPDKFHNIIELQDIE